MRRRIQTPLKLGERKKDVKVWKKVPIKTAGLVTNQNEANLGKYTILWETNYTRFCFLFFWKVSKSLVSGMYCNWLVYWKFPKGWGHFPRFCWGVFGSKKVVKDVGNYNHLKKTQFCTKIFLDLLLRDLEKIKRILPNAGEQWWFTMVHLPKNSTLNKSKFLQVSTSRPPTAKIHWTKNPYHWIGCFPKIRSYINDSV